MKPWIYLDLIGEGHGELVSRQRGEMMASWIHRKYDEAMAEKLAGDLEVSRLLAEILVKRGICGTEEASRFLYGKLEDLSDPFQLKDMDLAVARIEQAIAAGERIVVYGDYDVDGVCSIVILLECLQLLGANCSYYVPDRFSEGYGLNSDAIEKLTGEGCRLLISVDCGISSLAEGQQAGDLGMDLIITDHHTPLDELPLAVAIINPKLGGEAGCRDLAGAGVAFKLAEALCRQKMEQEELYNWLELVALATVADIVPLRGDNRIMVKYGLQKIEQSSRQGLRALLRETVLEDKTLRTWHIAFVLGPRLNSAGRLNSARNSIELLLAQDEERAAALAAFLCRVNEERKGIEETIFQEAVAEIEQHIDLEKEPILLLGGENWHDGVIGIVASRLSERYQRPCILVSWEGDYGKGSARSIAGMDIFAALDYAGGFLQQFGGHKMAAGLRLERRNFSAFKEKILEWAAAQGLSSLKPSERSIDAEIKPADINEALLQELELLQPCGEGNPLPLFLLRRVAIKSAALIGKGREHFKLKTETERGELEGIAFNRPQYMELPWRNSCQDLLFELTENEFRGHKRIQLKVKDIKCSFMPDRISTVQDKLQRVAELLVASMEELKKGRPVLFIYPTSRILKRSLVVLENYFNRTVLQALHGLMDSGERLETENMFRQGRPRIYLMTRAYCRYYLRKNTFPQNLRLVLELWPGQGKTLEYDQGLQRENLYPQIEEICWQKADWEADSPSPAWIYTNRKKTVESLKRRWPQAIVQSGIRELEQIRSLYQSGLKAGASVFLSDGVFAGIFPQNRLNERLFFADVPFSIYEAFSVRGQMTASSEEPVLALFDSQGIKSNWDYLNRVYPDLAEVKAWFRQLIELQQNPIIFDLNNWPALSEKFTRGKLLSVLHILRELDLCRWRKEGSIIEIKLHKPDSSTINLANSPYYLEGQAEKKHYQELERQIDKSLKW
ncbi:MAG: single-stranded-DNA-specific exonuclease RecJ [Syntrophomonas sp.]|nr:single-stranded-DNA-specific exonuclease RecJ [Syntrophomonas sp.]